MLFLPATLRAEENSQPVFTPVDISKQVNMAFVDERDGDGVGGWTDQGDNDLRNFPRGRQTFLSVPFEILDPNSRGEKAAVLLGSARKFPNEITLAPVPLRFDVLHVLHSGAWMANGTVGQYVLKYADGAEAKLDLVANQHLADWWYPVDLPGARVAWYGANRIRDLVGVWMLSWINPHPDKDVSAVVFRSSGAVIGICGLAAQKGGPLPSDVPVPTFQINLDPPSLVLRQNQPLSVRASIFHGKSEPLTAKCRLALFRGTGSKPLLALDRELNLPPKQVGKIDYAVDKLDLPAGPYRLVCTVSDQSAAIPVGVLEPDDRNPVYGMMYVGPPENPADFLRMKQAGFDWVSLDLLWKNLEPQPGKYDFSAPDRFIQSAKAAGLRVEIKTLLFEGSPWFDKTELVEKNWSAPSNFSEKFVEHYRALWQAIVNRYKNDPTVFAWCPTIGVQDNPVGLIDSDQTPSIKHAWRERLKRNGWTLEKITAATGTAVTDWNQVDPPRVQYANTRQPDDYFMEFMRLRRERAVEVYTRLCDAIRQHDPNRHIKLKMGQPWPVDVHDNLNGLWPTGWMRMCRQYRATLVHSSFEDTVAAAILPALADLHGVRMIVEEGKTPPSPPTTIAAVGHGARYDALGMEYCYWPLGKDLAAWSRLKPVVRRMQSFTRGYDNLYVTSLQDNLFATEKNWPAVQRYYVKCYDLLSKLAYQYHVVDTDTICKIPAGAVLLDANCTRLDDPSRQAIDQFVRAGGTFVGQFLTDSEADFALYKKWNFALTPHPGGKVGSFIAADGFSPAGPNAKPVLAWPDGKPAAVWAQIGKGKVFIVGCGFESDLASSARVLQSLLKKAGAVQQVLLDPYGQIEVAVKHRQTALQLALINKNPTPKKITLTLPPLNLADYQIQNWTNDEPITSASDNSLQLTIDPCQIVLLELTPKS